MIAPTVRARAPSNIALIKYMGKLDASRNIPMNASVSLTLSGFATNLEISPSPTGADVFHADESPDIGDAGRARALRFIPRLRTELETTPFPISLPHLHAPVRLKSANTFPHSAGIASSASAFAALTLGTVAFASGNSHEFRDFYASPRGKQTLAALARLGSGSSTRSFEGPFVTWQGTDATSIPSVLPALVDLVVLAGSAPKSVGSSEAHRRVLSSPLWPARMENISERHARMCAAIKVGNLADASRTARDEFLEMHALFHTCAEPFTYWNEGTKRVLAYLERHCPRLESLAIFTMDAGPNVHCLVPESDAADLKRELGDAFPDLAILEDREGRGAEVLL